MIFFNIFFRLVSAAWKCISHVAPDHIPASISVALNCRMKRLIKANKEVGGKVTFCMSNVNFSPSRSPT